MKKLTGLVLLLGALLFPIKAMAGTPIKYIQSSTSTQAGTVIHQASGTVNNLSADQLKYSAKTLSIKGPGDVVISSYSSAGAIMQPLTPSFLVTNSAGVNDVTGDGTTYEVTWPTEVYDQSGDFTSSTFTARVTGKYLLETNVFARGITSSHTSCYVSLFTSAREYRSTWTSTSGTVTGLPLHASAVADMTVGDIVHVNINCSGGTKVVDIDNDAKQNYFSGTLLN